MSSSCTSCLSTQWPCSWCIQLHSCVSNQSQCQDSPNPTVSLVSGIPPPTALVPTSPVFKLPLSWLCGNIAGVRVGVEQGIHLHVRPIPCGWTSGCLFPSTAFESLWVTTPGRPVLRGDTSGLQCDLLESLSQAEAVPSVLASSTLSRC